MMKGPLGGLFRILLTACMFAVASVPAQASLLGGDFKLEKLEYGRSASSNAAFGLHQEGSLGLASDSCQCPPAEEEDVIRASGSRDTSRLGRRPPDPCSGCRGRGPGSPP